MSEDGEVTFGLESSYCSCAGGGDCLPVGVVDEVAAGEDAGLVGTSGWMGDEDVSGVIEVYLPGQQFAARVVADGWTIQSGIFPENTASLALHHRCGFRTVGIRERIGLHHGTWRDVVLIERRSQAVPKANSLDTALGVNSFKG